MKKIVQCLGVSALALTLGISSCGNSGEDNDGPTGTPGTLSLRVTAPNGDPISGATVFIPGASALKLQKVDSRSKNLTDADGNSCADAPAGASFAACTNESGIANLACPGTESIVVQFAKGSFAGSINTQCGSDGTVAAAFSATGSVNMAVVTGTFDRIEDVLAKLGFGDVNELGILVPDSENFKLYDGTNSLDDSHKDFADVLLDPAELASNEVIFINCDEFALGSELSGDTATKLQNLRDFVSNGGKLYVTDLSYDYIEQAFPNYIDFGGGGLQGSTAESPGSAETGTDSEDANAKVNDGALAAWLDAISVNTGNPEADCGSTTVNGQIGARNPDGSIFIADLLPGWALMDGVETSPDGPVTRWIDGTELQSADRPLTATFEVGSSGGRVLYTSYHTADSCPTPGFWPQERVLQYLIFEL